LKQTFTSFSSNPLNVFVLGAILVAVHMLIVVFEPPFSEACVYSVFGAATLLSVRPLLSLAREASKSTSRRWYLMTAYIVMRGLLYFWAAGDTVMLCHSSKANALLDAASGACIVFALTLPPAAQQRGVGLLDGLLVSFFCGLYTPLVHGFITHPASNFLRIFGEHGILTTLATLGLAAALPDEATFYRSACFYQWTALLSAVCTNEIGYRLAGQHQDSPWALTGTLSQVIASLYFCYSYHREPIAVPPNRHRDIIRSLVPYSVGLAIIAVSVLLLEDDPSLARCGIGTGVLGFLGRIALTARTGNRQLLEPAHGLKDRLHLEAALASAKSNVGLHSPLAMIVFAVQEKWKGQSASTAKSEDRTMILVAGALTVWDSADNPICYLGSGRFAMLLPATSLRVALVLAKEVCLSLDALKITGPHCPFGIKGGVAGCVDTSHVSGLLSACSEALEQAQVDKGCRIRLARRIGKDVFDS
jgi:hypothetical protein